MLALVETGRNGLGMSVLLVNFFPQQQCSLLVFSRNTCLVAFSPSIQGCRGEGILNMKLWYRSQLPHRPDCSTMSGRNEYCIWVVRHSLFHPHHLPRKLLPFLVNMTFYLALKISYSKPELREITY